MRQQDQYLRPIDSLANAERPEISLVFDTRTDRNAVTKRNLAGQQIDTDQLANNAVTTEKIASNAITTTDISNQAVTNAKIAGFDWSKGTGGTINNATIVSDLITGGTINNAVVGTPNITGGTLKSALLGTSTITGGTFNAGVIGTPALTGGTVKPGLYMFGTYSGANGTITYLDGGTTAQTAIFIGGLFVSTSE